MVISRRKLLQTVSMLPVVSLLACNMPFNQTLGTVANDANVIATGLNGALTNIQSLNIPGLSTDKIATISVAIKSLQTVATALSGASSQAQAQPLVQQIETDLNAIVGALAGLPLPAEIALPLQAAAILLPVIEVAVNLAITQLHPPAPAGTPPAAALIRMTPDQARSLLIGAAKH